MFEPTCVIVGARGNLAGAIRKRFACEGFAVRDASRMDAGLTNCDVLVYHVDADVDVGVVSAFVRPALGTMRARGQGAVLFGGSAAQVDLRALIDSIAQEYAPSGILVRMVAFDEFASISAAVADLYWRLFFTPD